MHTADRLVGPTGDQYPIVAVTLPTLSMRDVRGKLYAERTFRFPPKPGLAHRAIA